MWRAARHPPSKPTKSFEGKTVLITGANSGVGYEAALKFAALHAARLIFGVRDLAKGEAAKAAITRIITRTNLTVDVYELNCESPSSIFDFAQTVIASTSRLDVALMNAGVVEPGFSLDREGWDVTLAVNVLAPAHLASLLLPKLQATAAQTGEAAVLEFTGSEGYLDVASNWVQLGADEGLLEHFNDARNFDMMRQYLISKLILMFVCQELAEAAKTGDVSVIVASPGMCKTNLGKNHGMAIKAIMAVFQFFVARTAEQGGRSLVSGAALGVDAAGGFWRNDQLNERSPLLDEAEYDKLRQVAWGEITRELKRRGVAIPPKEE